MLHLSRAVANNPRYFFRSVIKTGGSPRIP
jgi:hypothetical protein